MQNPGRKTGKETPMWTVVCRCDEVFLALDGAIRLQVCPDIAVDHHDWFNDNHKLAVKIADTLNDTTK